MQSFKEYSSWSNRHTPRYEEQPLANSTLACGLQNAKKEILAEPAHPVLGANNQAYASIYNPRGVNLRHLDTSRCIAKSMTNIRLQRLCLTIKHLLPALVYSYQKRFDIASDGIIRVKNISTKTIYKVVRDGIGVRYPVRYNLHVATSRTLPLQCVLLVLQ